MINHTNLWLALKRHHWNTPDLWEFEFPPAKYLPKGHPNRVKWEHERTGQTAFYHDLAYNLNFYSVPAGFTTTTMACPDMTFALHKQKVRKKKTKK